MKKYIILILLSSFSLLLVATKTIAENTSAPGGLINPNNNITPGMRNIGTDAQREIHGTNVIKVDPINQLNPQPEPPVNEIINIDDINKLNPQPDPPNNEIINTDDINKLNPQPDPPNNEIINTDDIKNINRLNPQPEPPMDKKLK